MRSVLDLWRRRAAAARLVLCVLGIWVLLGLFLGAQVCLNYRASGRLTAVGWIFADSVRRYLIYALLTFPILWLCRRFAPESGRWRKALVVHVAGCAAFILLYSAIRVTTAVNPETRERLPVSFEAGAALARRNLFEQSWMYGSIVAVVLTLQSYQKIRQREMEEADLRRRMAEYELQILKLQLHPHFLFNTLNGISALMTRDVRTAREMLVRLADLLRIALAHTRDREVSLGEELGFVNAYLELERMRLGGRLRVEMKLDPAALEARVPNMLLQPLVENAIRHGVAAVPSGGVLGIAASRLGDSLRIDIVNDGPPIVAEALLESDRGTGLRNTRARLRHLYGDGWELRLSNRSPGGVELRLEIPFRGIAGLEARIS